MILPLSTSGKIVTQQQQVFFTYFPNYKIEQIDKEIVRTDPHSLFARGVVLNKNYNIEPNDLFIAKQNPESNFAVALEARLNLKDEVSVS